MRALLVHNHYGDYVVGGEANVFNSEVELLRSHGHDVETFEVSNSEINASIKSRLTAIRDVAWSPKSQRRIADVIEKFRPDVMHVHNYWLVLTPSIFEIATQQGVATVLTIHNYRMVCPGGQFQRNNRPCEECLDGNAWRVLRHRCYPGKSLLKSALSLRLFLETRRRGFLSDLVDQFVLLSQFAYEKHAAGGLAKAQMTVKPNFMPDPLEKRAVPPIGDYAICVGRVSPEKGVPELLEAWRSVDFPLKIVGDGPLTSAKQANVEFTGALSHEDTLKLIGNSAFMVFPSTLYEGFPLSMLEAMAFGRPCIASDLGARREILGSSDNGVLYESGNVQDLANKSKALAANHARGEQIGRNARMRFLGNYTARANYPALMKIYEQAIARRQSVFKSTTMDKGMYHA